MIRGGRLVLVLVLSLGHLLVVVPDQRLVATISSANGREYSVDDEALSPLVNEVIMHALEA